MPAGTIKLTNNSTTVTGTGTSFATELTANDFLVAVVGGVTYTLGVKSVESNTGLTLVTAYNGPTTTGLAWTPVPNATLVGITAQVAADVAKAIRGLNLDKNNWQQVFSGTGNITITLPDGSQFTGPAWNAITALLNNKARSGDNNDITSLSALTTAISIAQGGTGAKDAAAARNNLGLGSSAIRDALSSDGKMLSEGDGGMLTHTPPLIERDYSQYPSQIRRSGGGANVPSYGSGIYLGYDNDICFHLHIEGGGAMRYRYLRAERIIYDYVVYSTGNTTKSSDGTLKAASPVVRIVKSKSNNQRTDVAETGFEWCGAGTCNTEAHGVTVERISTGVYVISGSAGLARDGWQLFPPRDPAGSGDLGIVDADEDEDGSVTVRLYRRRYQLDSESGDIFITRGEPIDVPANSWIDVRLQMPDGSSQ